MTPFPMTLFFFDSVKISHNMINDYALIHVNILGTFHLPSLLNDIVCHVTQEDKSDSRKNLILAKFSRKLLFQKSLQ